MAVTSIWPIKGRVDKVINYARNPEKTHDKKSLLKLHEIEGVIEYAADEMKTETRALVTCLNLSSEENAAKEFMEVKHRYGKEDGRACYHGYQSFKEAPNIWEEPWHQQGSPAQVPKDACNDGD